MDELRPVESGHWPDLQKPLLYRFPLTLESDFSDPSRDVHVPYVHVPYVHVRCLA